MTWMTAAAPRIHRSSVIGHRSSVCLWLSLNDVDPAAARHTTFEVPVPGGTLRVGQWGDGAPVVLAAHGLTANHLHFQALADQLGQETTLVAPDLRGRGRSAEVAGPAGMTAHADDLARVLDHIDVAEAMVVGHSMGAFVAVVLAHRHPERVRSLVLVDGGLPLDVAHLAALPIEETIRAVVGPALDRLRLTFATRDAYRDYWRGHPALADHWNGYLEAAYDYDLEGHEPELRSSVRERAVLEDGASQLRSGQIEAALAYLAQAAMPAVLIRAPRGLFNQVPPLYPNGAMDAARIRLPQLTDLVVPNVNHYTVLLTARGARSLAEVIRARLDS